MRGMKLLHLKTSLFGDQGQSAKLAEEFLQLWRAKHASGTIVTRDLAAAPLPHLDGERFGAFLAAPEQRSAAQQAIVAESDALIEELRAADELLIGMPMYNFAAPTQFKVWIDHIARAGVSFRYTENGPVGLLGSKRITVIATRGGQYSGTPADAQTPWLRQIFGFLGFNDVTFIYAEGYALGAEAAAKASEQGRAQIRAYFA